MIGWLSGSVRHTQNETVILEVNGVGYEVTVTRSGLASASKDPSSVSLVIYTDVKETSIALFGFSSWVEREVFLLLRKVKGIGSKLALAIVSALGAEGVLVAIGTGDHAQLESVSGVGKKTAQRVLIELREHVQELLPSSRAGLIAAVEIVRDSQASVFGLKGIELDAALALEKLGFSRDKAGDAVQKAVASDPSRSFTDAGELLKDALRNL